MHEHERIGRTAGSRLRDRMRAAMRATGSSLRRRARAAGRRMRAALGASAQRLADAAPSIAHVAAAVVSAYAIAHYALGHEFPAIACTVALSSLSLQRDCRPSRVAGTAVAMVLGITISATVVHLAGRGPGQVAFTLLTVLGLAVALSKVPAFAISAGTQSMLVAVLPDPEGGPYLRALDGVVGGCVALAFTALLPFAAFARATSSGRLVLESLLASVRGIRVALETADPEAARGAFERARRTDRLSADWKVSLESARAVAGMAIMSRGSRARWRHRRRMLTGLESTVRDVEAIARRAAVLAESGRPQRRAAAVVEDLERMLATTTGAYSRGEGVPAETMSPVLEGIHRLSRDGAVDQGLVAMLRLVAVDCLIASGVDDGEARRRLPRPLLATITSPIALPLDRG